MISLAIKHDVVIICFNNGLKSTCHYYEFPKDVVSFPPQKIIRSSVVPVKTISDFNELALHYKESNPVDRCFPPFHYLENGKIELLVKCLMLKKEDSQLTIREALVGYSYINHLKIFGYNRKDLEFIDFHFDHDNTIFFIDSSKDLVVYIRLVEGILSISNFQKELKRCDDFVKAFLLLHENTLKEKSFEGQSFGVCALVALPDMTKEDVEENLIFTKCDHPCILSKGDFSSGKVIQSRLRKFSMQIKKKIEDVKTANKAQPQTYLFQLLLSQAMATIALKNCCLPRLTKNIFKQVLSLLLNKDQYFAIKHPFKKRIIRGPYGSGKSLILEKIAEDLLLSNENNIVYYILYDPLTLLQARMENLPLALSKSSQNINLENLENRFHSTNIHQILTNAGENTNIFDISKAIEICGSKHPGQIVNMLFDEVDASDLTEEKCKAIKNCLSFNNLQDSTVVFALQCTEKVYGDNVKKHVPTDNCLSETGMKLLPPFDKGMRMVKSLHDLKDIAEKIVSDKPYELAIEAKEFETINTSRTFYDQNKPKKSFDYSKETILNPNAASFIPMSKRSEHSTKKVDLKVDDVKVDDVKADDNEADCLNRKQKETESVPQIPTNSSTVESFTIPESIANSVEAKTKNEIVEQSPNLVSMPKLPIDQLSMLCSNTLFIDPDKAVQKISFGCSFPKSISGVNIEGKKPSIIYLPNEFNDTPEVKASLSLSHIFKHFIDTSEKTTIVCSSIEEVHLTLFALEQSSIESDQYCHYIPFLKQDTVPSSTDKKKIWNKCNADDHLVLVTDFRGFRGCESENCVTFIDPDERYTNHILVEVFARAVVNLVALVLPSKESSVVEKDGCFQQILDAWEKENVVDIYKVSLGNTSDGVSISISGKSDTEEMIVTDDLNPAFGKLKRTLLTSISQEENEKEMQRYYLLFLLH